jgi:phenylalanyl-tRNA synthetase beta chain
MPTINFSFRDLQELIGKRLTIDELKDLLSYCKAEFEDYDTASDEVKADFGDTNLPYLWSVEGVARLLKGVLNLDRGIPPIRFSKNGYKIIVDKSTKKVRPYIAAFVAKSYNINESFLKQLIQLQEKLCENYGRKRKKVSIGLYSYKRVKFPVHYKAVPPDSIKFTPLEGTKELNLSQILEQHPKGIEYDKILKGFDKYPILIDSAGEVLSFPPIINSNFSGKVEIGDEELFFEVTGDDQDAILLATNIFAQALYERSFELFSVDIRYSDKRITTPSLFKDKLKITTEDVTNLLGLDLKDTEIKALLEKARYDYNKGSVQVPPYRKDILHKVDVIEDIGIMYDYNKIEELPLKSYTIGETLPITNFIDKIRELIVGFGYQELLNPMLSNKELLYKKMNTQDFGTVEISKYLSETYSVVRTWLLPILLEFLSKNKHVEYPQKIFEQGLVTCRKEDKIIDYERLAVISAHSEADFTEIKKVLDALTRSLGITYTIEETEHSSFIPGRVGRVIIKNRKVAYIGELCPKVIGNFGIEVPVVGLELNLTELYEATKTD